MCCGKHAGSPDAYRGNSGKIARNEMSEPFMVADRP